MGTWAGVRVGMAGSRTRETKDKATNVGTVALRTRPYMVAAVVVVVVVVVMATAMIHATRSA